MDGFESARSGINAGPAPARSTAERDFLRRRLDRTRERKPQAPAVPRARRDRPLPLSFAQQRMWFLQELAPGNPFYNIPAAVPLNGPIDRMALEAALNAIIERHESLRTVIGRVDGQPRQTVRPHEHIPLDLLDLSSHGAREAERRLDAISTNEAETAFDLATGPLIRFRLVRTAPARHVLLLTVHHIAADGWSMSILFRELVHFYEAFRAGREPDLPALRVHYGDFAQWQRKRLSDAELYKLLAYWREKLTGAQDLPLITDRPRPPVATFRGDFLDFSLDRGNTGAVRKLAREHDCTLFQAMLAAFKAVLARFAGTDDVVVGAPIANRVHPELEPLIGFFVNSLALRSDLSGDPTFAQILGRVRETTLEAYAHQDLPFERLVEELRPERDLSRNPLFQVSFQIQNAPGIAERPVPGGENFRRIERSSAILDFAFSLWETPDGLAGGIEYSTDLFDRESVERIAKAVKLVVEAVVADPSLPLSRLPLLETGESRRLERLLRGPKDDFAPMTMASLFAETCARYPHRTALVDEAGELSFTELDQLSGRVAQAFSKAGIGRGEIVGLALERGRGFVACMLATAKLGAAYLPIDPDVPPGRLKAMIEVARPAIVILGGESPALAHGASAGIDDLLAFAANCDPLESAVKATGEDPCYVLFTSGSTGTPKAVEVSHRALANHMHWMRRAFAVVPEDRVLQRTPPQFDASIWEFWLPLVSGASLCLPRPFRAADANALGTAIEAFQPTIIQCVPSLLPHILAACEPGKAREAVRLLCCGGEPLLAPLVADVRRTFPLARLVNLYGPTEAAIDATWHEVALEEDGPPPIGRPIANAFALVVDEYGALCPPNMRGEIAIGGAPLANGYLGQDELTGERFVHLPANGQRAFLTGDIGWYGAGGVLHCAGRKDRQVKLRGNRIELGEIEAVLEQHEFVRRAALVMHEERGEPALTSFLTLRDTDQVEALRREIEDEVVGHWEGLYRVVYAEDDAASPIGAADDFTGWTSSFTGRPIPLDQMRRWASETAMRIGALAPAGIFEIGCGSGLMLSRLAPECARYVGCDISAPVISRLRAWVQQNDLDAVDLSVAKAQDAAQIPIAGCDTLVLNSVVQYFPSAAHLRNVLEANATRMPGDARLFIGDVRPLGLLRAFHSAVEVARADESATLGELRPRVEAACAQEKELLFDPEFFRRFGAGEGRLRGDVAIRLKNGADDNELFGYRFDVAIRPGEPRPVAPLQWANWRRGESDIAHIRHAIERYSAPLAVAGIPNLRVAQAVALSHLLRDGDEAASRAQLVREAARLVPDGADPGAIAELARAHGLVAELLPSREHPDRFDLVVHDGVLAGFNIDAAQPGAGAGAGGAPLSSEPSLRAMTARIAPQLRAFLAEHLPPVMCPARINVLERMPALPSGKLDYVSLARHVPHEPVRETQFEAPSDALEQVVADIFAAVLDVTQVGAGDDFFAALGGHSLLATQAVARLREIFGDELPLRLLFEHPTPAALARCLTEDLPEARGIAEQYLAMQELDESALDALLAQAGSTVGG